jgi:hypothetical protein
VANTSLFADEEAIFSEDWARRPEALRIRSELELTPAPIVSTPFSLPRGRANSVASPCV